MTILDRVLHDPNTPEVVAPLPPQAPVDPAAADEDARLRLGVCAACAAPVVLVSTVSALQFSAWQWIALTLTAPVVTWGAAPLHRAAWAGLQRGEAVAAALVSVAVVAAFCWSVFALLLGTAGAPGTRQPFTLLAPAGDPIHLGAAAALTTFALAVRYVVRPDAGSMAGSVAQRAGAAVLAAAVGALGFWLGAGAGPATAIPVAIAVVTAGLLAPLGLATALPRRLAAPMRVRATGLLATAETIVLTTDAVTTGALSVAQVHPLACDDDGDQALRLAGAVEQAADHPIGAAITATAQERHGELPGVSEFDSLPGLGVRGLVSELDGETVIAHAVLVGAPGLLAEHRIELSAAAAATVAQIEAGGACAVAVAWDGEARAVIAVSPQLRPDTPDGVAALRALGVTPVLAGDPAVDRAVAAAAGIATGPDGLGSDSNRPDGADGAIAVLESGTLAELVADVSLAYRARAVTRGNDYCAAVISVAGATAAACGWLTPMTAGLVTVSGAVLVAANSLRLAAPRAHAGQFGPR